MSGTASAARMTPALVDAIRAFADLGQVLVATDFDGVLAPLVLDPSASRPQPGTIEALRALAALPHVTVAVASGRDLETLRTLTGFTTDGDAQEDAGSVVLIGSHGAQSNVSLTAGAAAASGELSETERAALAGAAHALESIVERLPGARVEYKPAGVVLHTRGMDDDDAARATRAAEAVPQDVPGVHAMRGKSVVELSVLDVSKGAALTALASSRGAAATLYLGDDVTDETVFTTLRPGVDVGIKVGDGVTAAQYRVEECTAVPSVLDRVREALSP